MFRTIPLALAALFVAAASALAQDWRASCLTARGQDKVLSCTKALEAEPKDLALRRALARAFMDVGDGMGGTGEYGAIVQDRPDDPEAWFDYATSLATDYRFAEAAAAIERALKLDPNRAAEAGHFGAMAMLAKIYGEGLYGQAKDPAQAAKWAKRAE